MIVYRVEWVSEQGRQSRGKDKRDQIIPLQRALLSIPHHVTHLHHAALLAVPDDGPQMGRKGVERDLP